MQQYQRNTQFAESLMGMWEEEYPAHVKKVRDAIGDKRFEKIVDDAATEALLHFVQTRSDTQKDLDVLGAFEVAYRLVTLSYLLSKAENLKERSYAY